MFHACPTELDEVTEQIDDISDKEHGTPLDTQACTTFWHWDPIWIIRTAFALSV